MLRGGPDRPGIDQLFQTFHDAEIARPLRLPVGERVAAGAEEASAASEESRRAITSINTGLLQAKTAADIRREAIVSPEIDIGVGEEGIVVLMHARRCVAGVGRIVEIAERDAGGRADGPTSAEREELGRLRRENHRLRQERDILAKAAAWFARESKASPNGFTGS